MDEPAYRRLVDDAFQAVDAAFADVDPDVAESDYQQGTLAVTFHGKHRLILSPQPPVRQIWLAFRDRAWHFSRDQASARWVDDRHGRELFALVAELAHEAAGVTVRIVAR